LVVGLIIKLIACTSEPEHTQPSHQRQPQLRPATETAATLYSEGLERIKNRDLAGAADAFSRVLALAPQHYEANLGLGEIHLRQRRYDNALEYFTTAIKINPKRLEARFQAARSHRSLRQPLKARRLLADLLEDHPDHLQTRLLLADLLMTAAPPDPGAALEQYRAVLARRPDHRQARAGAAASQLRLGHFAQAVSALDSLLETHPADPHLSFLLGAAHHWQGNFNAAVKAYRQAIDALPEGAPQRRVRQWNLYLAYRQAHGTYPGDLAPAYRLDLPPSIQDAPVRFTDIAPEAGLDKKDRGRGNAWGDFDLDGRLDLFTVGIQTPHALFLNRGDNLFADVAPQAGLADGRGGWAALAADSDNDGDLDLYVTRDAWEGQAPNSLYINNGNAVFTDTAPQAGVAGDGDSFIAAWGDLDNNGFVDLYVAEGITGNGRPNKLYANRGDGTFTDIAVQAGVGHPGKSLGVALGDIDADGDLDIYVADVAGPNTLYRNEGDHFTDISVQAGVTRPESGGYVAFFFDGNNDGSNDLFVSGMSYYEHFVASRISDAPVNSSRAHLYRNNNDGTFSDIAPGSGLARNFGSMGADFGDIDYDGRIDIYLCNGGPVMTRFEPNTLFHNRGDGFADITDAAGVGNLGKGHGASFADYDSDGDLDLYAGVGGHYPGDRQANSLYRNEGTANGWLAVNLQGRASNRSAIGARLHLYRGGILQSAEIASGSGFGSTNSLTAEFGLGLEGTADSLTIHWPSGVVQSLTDLGSNRTLHVVEGEKR
jgi:tetratricopeptide (TPR) repeat protein